MRHNLAGASGNAVPAEGTLNNNPDSGADALLFSAQNITSDPSSPKTIADSGLMDFPEEFNGALAAGADVPSRNNACIGMTTGGIRLRKEQDTVVFTSDQLRGPFDEDATSNSWAVDCSLMELSLWNLALAWGRGTAAIGSSSMMLMKAGDQEFHALALWTKGPQKNFSNSTGARRRAKRVYQFFKVKSWANGEIPHTREDVQSIPVTFSTYCDGNENWGVMFDAFKDFDGTGHGSQAIAIPDYNVQPS
jgi:hypothetical protein